MTRKDCELIAGVLRQAPIDREAKATVVNLFAVALADDSPAFQPNRFVMAALGFVTEPVEVDL